MSIWSIAMIYRRGFSAFGLQPIQTFSHAIGCNLGSELQSIPIIMSNFSVLELCTSLYIYVKKCLTKSVNISDTCYTVLGADVMDN
jgi:hypothetical protein